MNNTTMTTDQLPTTMATPKVYSAILSAMNDIGSIGKHRKNAQQGYSFRGVDDVLNSLQPVLIKNNLLIIPNVISQNITEHPSKSGGTLFRVICEMKFSVVSVLDGSRLETTFIGEAMDSGDKATNKAMSTAYKYFAFQLFCIPTDEVKDTETDSPEVAKKQHYQKPDAPITPNESKADDEREWLNLRNKNGGVTPKGEAALNFIRGGGAIAEIAKKYKINKADMQELIALENSLKNGGDNE